MSLTPVKFAQNSEVLSSPRLKVELLLGKKGDLDVRLQVP
jgi:hypothetical protein